MKHVRKALVFLILIVTPLFLAGVLPPAIDNEVKVTNSQTTIKVNTPSYEDIAPIIAINDTLMDYYASLLSWEGNGQPDTPYIIEGYNITSDSNCIEIRDTTKAFEIRNCLISSFSGSDGDGITIDNVTQGSIFDTIVEGKSDGVAVVDSPSFMLDNCTIHDCGYGISYYTCHGAQISSCYIYEIQDTSIYIYHSNDTITVENEIHNGGAAGLDLPFSHYAVVENNVFTFCDSFGIYVGSSHYVVIENNIIHDTTFGSITSSGIRLSNAPFTTIVGNEIYDNERHGIFAELSDWLYIFDNEIYDNSDHGIDVIDSTNGTILQNNIYGNGWDPEIINAMCGVYLGLGSEDWLIQDNTVWNNTPAGITLEYATDCDILHNEIFENEEYGIYGLGVGGSDFITIQENNIHGNGWEVHTGGIIFYGYENCTIHGNTIYNNTGSGILSHGPDNNITFNNVYDTVGKGINIEMTNDNLVLENLVYDNTVAGIFLYAGYTDVIENIVHDNGVGVYLYGSSWCNVYMNDIGWNGENALQEYGTATNLWNYVFEDIGNHWSDYIPPTGETIDRYAISNGTHNVAYDLYPDQSLNLTSTGSVSYEILETGNVLTWDAYAKNPSHYEIFVDGESVLIDEWDGGNIEYLADGLSHGTHTIGVEVFHISGHSLENGTTADVEDLTPPVVEGPTIIEIVLGEDVNVHYIAVDPSGIHSYVVNDTAHFTISSTGFLTNIVDLEIGNYTLLLEIADPHGNAYHMFVTVVVSAPGGGGIPTTLLLTIGGVGTIILLVVVVIGYKRRQG